MTNQQFAQEIDGLFTKVKAGGLDDRQARFDEVEALTERYFAANDEMPPAPLLDRLATLCLREELTDTDRMKSRNNEYPFHSEHQTERRKREEISQTWAREVGQDGRDYRPKTRDTNRKMREISGDY